MAGKPLTRASREVIDSLDEEEVWLAYLEARTVRKMLKLLSEKTGHDMRAGHSAFYDWLDAEEGRRMRWARVKRMRGDMAFDEVEELADSITEDNVRPTEAKIRAKQWIAERLNRTDYGKQGGSVNVTINTKNAWLGALKEAESVAVSEDEAVEEGDYEMIESGEE